MVPPVFPHQLRLRAKQSLVQRRHPVIRTTSHWRSLHPWNYPIPFFKSSLLIVIFETRPCSYRFNSRNVYMIIGKCRSSSRVNEWMRKRGSAASNHIPQHPHSQQSSQANPHMHAEFTYRKIRVPEHGDRTVHKCLYTRRLASENNWICQRLQDSPPFPCRFIPLGWTWKCT